MREAREIATWHPNIIVKLPTIPDGVRALSILSKENIRVNMTLVFSSPQALLVAKAGAYFVSPFLGRLDDISSDGLTVLREIMDIYQAYKYPTQVLAASLRHPPIWAITSGAPSNIWIVASSLSGSAARQ